MSLLKGTTGSRPYLALTFDMTGFLNAIGNACPSEEDVCPLTDAGELLSKSLRELLRR
jgi:hypothetical protein